MFSKRNGYIPEKIIQLNSLDEDSRKSIWDLFYIFTKDNDSVMYLIARRLSCSRDGFNLSHQEFERSNSEIGVFDTYTERRYDLENFRDNLKNFIYNSEWNRVFDIIELYITETGEIKANDDTKLISCFNSIFENESIWYKITGDGIIIKITDEQELNEINDTILLPKLSKSHFENSIIEFSKRKDANYKLVAREAIDWIEALLREVLNDEKIILWRAINKMQSDQKYSKYNLFFDWLDKIWAFANDQLRHAEKNDESIIWFYDAKFILVLSSSIANYIQSIR